MRAVIQRTIRSSVTSEGTETGRIGAGLTVLLGVGRDDDEKDVVYTADKILNLRIFEDEEGKMNQSLLQKGGEMLVWRREFFRRKWSSLWITTVPLRFC